MEKWTKNFVWKLVEKFCSLIASSPTLEDQLCSFTCLEFGMLLVDSGWYTEAVVLLRELRIQSKDQPVHELCILRTLLLAESLSSRHEASKQTIRDIKILLPQTENIPSSTLADVHSAIAVSLFEQCEFEASYQQGLSVLELLTDYSDHEVIVSALRQLAKVCLARRQLRRAKLLITQAVSWASHNFGPMSITYARALEDYAFCLLTMRAYGDCIMVHSEAKDIYCNAYGCFSLHPDLAMGNLAFWLYLESRQYPEFGSIETYLQFVVDLDAKVKSEVEHPEERQAVACRRIRLLTTVERLAQQGDVVKSDRRVKVQPQHSIAVIKRLFSKFPDCD
ncbi:amyloid protein-binding protein 2-like [Sabethes cyaneus]|uniref:amyloid protein-binding protein 2-like n=1 Tax=Sabethes cyaneus TaxID=53552 RepID=UPI00237D3745|nr:amyloid protein-binding protein 2-like [Sabethes cyaneus]